MFFLLSPPPREVSKFCWYVRCLSASVTLVRSTDLPGSTGRQPAGAHRCGVSKYHVNHREAGGSEYRSQNRAQADLDLLNLRPRGSTWPNIAPSLSGRMTMGETCPAGIFSVDDRRLVPVIRLVAIRAWIGIHRPIMSVMRAILPKPDDFERVIYLSRLLEPWKRAWLLHWDGLPQPAPETIGLMGPTRMPLLFSSHLIQQKD